MKTCRQCNADLLFSARQRGEGLCSRKSDKRLAVFLYLLARDHLPMGAIESLLREAEREGEPVFSTTTLASWALDSAKRLK